MKDPKITLKNPRTGEIWICPDFVKRRIIDGSEFVEVHQPGSTRLVWMSLSALTKVKEKRTPQGAM